MLAWPAVTRRGLEGTWRWDGVRRAGEPESSERLRHGQDQAQAEEVPAELRIDRLTRAPVFAAGAMAAGEEVVNGAAVHLAVAALALASLAGIRAQQRAAFRPRPSSASAATVESSPAQAFGSDRGGGLSRRVQ